MKINKDSSQFEGKKTKRKRNWSEKGIKIAIGALAFCFLSAVFLIGLECGRNMEKEAERKREADLASRVAELDDIFVVGNPINGLEIIYYDSIAEGWRSADGNYDNPLYDVEMIDDESSYFDTRNDLNSDTIYTEKFLPLEYYLNLIDFVDIKDEYNRNELYCIEGIIEEELNSDESLLEKVLQK